MTYCGHVVTYVYYYIVLSCHNDSIDYTISTVYYCFAVCITGFVCGPLDDFRLYAANCDVSLNFHVSLAASAGSVYNGST